MLRRPRLIVPNTAHHVYQRSVNEQAIFLADKDYRTYLEILSEQARLYKTDILAWCLMRDNINIVATPGKKDSLAKTIGRTHFAYSQYINKRRRRKTSIWHNRFQSCALDKKFLQIAVNYVENQPVYDRLVCKAEKYPWSSAQSHITGEDEFGLVSLDHWPSRRTQKTWSGFLSQKLDRATCQKICTYTQTGRPLGSQSFIAGLEKKYRRRLHPLAVGRPRKED